MPGLNYNWKVTLNKSNAASIANAVKELLSDRKITMVVSDSNTHFVPKVSLNQSLKNEDSVGVFENPSKQTVDVGIEMNNTGWRYFSTAMSKKTVTEKRAKTTFYFTRDQLRITQHDKQGITHTSYVLNP